MMHLGRGPGPSELPLPAIRPARPELALDLHEPVVLGDALAP